MPPPPPTKFCKARRRLCRVCEMYYPAAHTYDICPECGTSMICGKPVVKDFSECQDHRGPNPNKGNYGMQSDLSKFPIVKLAERYKKMITDGRILSLRASIEVVRGRIAQLAERIDFNDAPDRLYKLDDLWKQYLEAKKYQKGADMVILEKQISNEFASAREDYAAWQQMLQALDLDRKLVDSEVKIVKEMHAILTAEDAHDLIAKLLSIILRVFAKDKKGLRQVQYEFVRLIGDRPGSNFPPMEEEQEDVLDGVSED